MGHWTPSGDYTFNKGVYHPTDRIDGTLLGSQKVYYIGEEYAEHVKKKGSKVREYIAVISVNIRNPQKPASTSVWIQGYGSSGFSDREIPRNLIRIINKDELDDFIGIENE